MPDKLTPRDIRMAFTLVFGREPENSAIAERMSARFSSLDELRKNLMASPEFKRPGVEARRRKLPVSRELLDWSRNLAQQPEMLDDAMAGTVDDLLRRVLFSGESRHAEPRRVLSKSMPRSGHHFLVKLLRDYFGPEFEYCEFYKPTDCCHRMPCSKPRPDNAAWRFFLQKSHDFALEDPVDPEQAYIIEYRHPVPRIQSDFELAVQSGQYRDSSDDFWLFMERSVRYQVRFYTKWMAVPPPDSIVLGYERLSESPEAELARVAKFFSGESPDPARIRDSVERVRPTRAESSSTFTVRNPEQHRYHDPVRAEEVERRVIEACPGMDIPRLFS